MRQGSEEASKEHQNTQQSKSEIQKKEVKKRTRGSTNQSARRLVHSRPSLPPNHLSLFRVPCVSSLAFLSILSPLLHRSSAHPLPPVHLYIFLIMFGLKTTLKAIFAGAVLLASGTSRATPGEPVVLIPTCRPTLRGSRQFLATDSQLVRPQQAAGRFFTGWIRDTRSALCGGLQHAIGDGRPFR